VNGAGKSTFSRIVAGVEEPTAGARKQGHKVTAAYFSQNHAEELNPERTVLESLEEVATARAAGNLRTLLGAFLFRGDDVFKRVGVLSGGERSRVALARMLVAPANFLILDEPTNHLDMQSQEVLQRALAAYTGTYVIVSHNRAFLDPIVTKVLEFIPGRPQRLFLGNVSYYLEKKAAEEGFGKVGATASASSDAGRKTGGGIRKEQRRLEARERQEKARQLKPLKSKLAELEAGIHALEEEKAMLTEKLIDPGFFKQAEAAREATQRFHRIEDELQKALSHWSELSDKIEKLEAGSPKPGDHASDQG
jgi:ATP-binding cassette subfamily F protein 3